MSAPPTAAFANMACLHCSPARTVWLRSNQPDGMDLVEKVYVAGAMADAEHELAMGQAAAGDGVVTYISVQTDALTNRPSVTLRFEPGDNLEAMVAMRGAIPAAEALRRLATVAHTLARLHSLRSQDLPRGMCHGDVKPQNLLASTEGYATKLIDFEHARAIDGDGRWTENQETSEQEADNHEGGNHEGGNHEAGNQEAGKENTLNRAFTGGTSAYSPPEAHVGATANEAFDVFGLGATLAFLLDGGIAKRIPRHPEVDALLMACCATNPAARPTAAEVAARCQSLATELQDDAAEQHLHDWATGACRQPPPDTEQANQQTSRTLSDDARTATWPRRRRLLLRLPTLLREATQIPVDPTDLQQELDLILRVLARFPRNERALARRRDLLAAIRKLLTNAAATIRTLHKAEQFEQAMLWLRTTDALVMTAMSVAGGLTNIVRIEPGNAPNALQRAPIEFLRRLTLQTESAKGELQERIDDISAAERALDLNLVEQRIDEMATHYGGTSKTVAERRDQLHRLDFYLDRIVRSESNVERIGPLWDPVALAPLEKLVNTAAQTLATRTRLDTASSSTGNGGAVGLRSLQLTLANITEEFGHLDQVPPALQALSRALRHLTDQAWQQLSDAEQRLCIVPVPVRPLQLALGRLDSFRVLEAFIDRPDRPRSELLDGLERLRLGLEQARSARDRLAENAEHALARGHWTTGLFEMERAVAGIHANDDRELVEAERLKDRLAAARRTKQEIEGAVRRNVALANTYTTLEDDPVSTFEARLRTLRERCDCLMFLTMHVPNERAELYRLDLRSVETQLAVERAGQAEQRLDALTDPGQRLRLARETLENLGAADLPSHDSSSSGSSSTDSSSFGPPSFGSRPTDGTAHADLAQQRLGQGALGTGSLRELPGRVVRLQEHWRTVAAHCQRSVDAAHRKQLVEQRQRRRSRTITMLAFLITATAIGFAIKPWLLGEPAMAAPSNSNPSDSPPAGGESPVGGDAPNGSNNGK